MIFFRSRKADKNNNKGQRALYDGEGLIKVKATVQHKEKYQQEKRMIPQWKRYDKEDNSISMRYDFFSFFFLYFLSTKKEKINRKKQKKSGERERESKQKRKQNLQPSSQYHININRRSK